MERRKLMAVLIVAALVLALSACRGEEPSAGGSSAAAPPATGGSEATAEAEEDVVLSAEDLVNHEIYKHLDDQALTGVLLPVQKDRSAINKALPVEQKKDVVVGWSEPTMSSAWFAGVQEGAKQYAAEYGYDLKFYVAEGWDAAQQSTDIETMISLGVDVLVLDAADIQAQAVDIDKCVAAGIPVISMYPMKEDVPVVTAVTANYYEMSYAAGYYAAQQFDEPIEAAFIPGQIGHPIADSRTCGFLGGWCYGKIVKKGQDKGYREDGMLAGYNAFRKLVSDGSVDLPEYDLKVAGMANGAFSDVGGMAAAEDLLTAYPNISMIFPDNDHEGAGAIKVLEQRGMLDQVKVITGCDGDMNMLELVKEGKLTSTGYNNPVAITKGVFKLINMMFEQGYDANNMPSISPFYYELYDINNYMDVYEEGTEYGKIFDIDFVTIPEMNAAAGK